MKKKTTFLGGPCFGGAFCWGIYVFLAHEASKLMFFHPEKGAQSIVFVGPMRFRTFALEGHFCSFLSPSKIVLPPAVGVTFPKKQFPPCRSMVLRGYSSFSLDVFLFLYRL